MTATTQVLKKLQLLQELVGKQKDSDEVLEATIAKLLHYELEKLQGRQNQIREKLNAFEERYHPEDGGIFPAIPRRQTWGRHGFL